LREYTCADLAAPSAIAFRQRRAH